MSSCLGALSARRVDTGVSGVVPFSRTRAMDWLRTRLFGSDKVLVAISYVLSALPRSTTSILRSVEGTLDAG